MTAVWNRREWLRRAGMGAAVLTFAPHLLAKEPVVSQQSRISDEDEIALGNKFAEELEREEPIASNPVIDAYLNNMVHELAAKSQRPNMPYHAKLVNTMEVNACSIPGGGLYVNRGLLELVTSEDQLAATLGHEIGHVVGRHAINQLLMTFKARALLKPVLENLHKNNGVIQQIILKLGGAVGMLAMLHFSREDEAQADLLGFYEMLRAGWNPHGFVKMFEMLEQVERASGGAPPPFLSDHPPTPQRLAAIERELREVSIPANAKSDSMSFHAAKAAIRLLPAPQKRHKPEPADHPQQ
jgi:predicted Zn-dependent protease